MKPFFWLLDMWDHMRQLLASYAALSATKHDEKLEVVTGTRIREVPAEYFSAKKELLKNGNISRPEQIRSSLQAFEEKWHCLERRRAAKAKATKGNCMATKGVGNSYA